MLFIGRHPDGRQINSYAHRVAYVLAHGDIPAGSAVMHSCDVRACVNPAHLRLGTQQDNIRDASAKGRLPKERPGAWALTNEQVRDVRASVETCEALAQRYGVSKTHISLVRRGLRRKAA
jgi:hypothetical protein